MQSQWKTVWPLLKRLNIKISYDSAIPFLSIYPEDLKTYVYIKLVHKVFTHLCIAALFIIASNWKQLKHPPVVKRVNQLWYTHTTEIIIQPGKGIPHSTMWMNLENIMLNERSQTQRAYIIWFHSYEMCKTGKTIQRESWIMVAMDWGQERNGEWLLTDIKLLWGIMKLLLWN